MTNPVILLGTQSNGETLPVQVDATGRLVAEGLQGEPGEPGAQGDKGDKGDPGDPGAPGAPGANGNDGADGEGVPSPYGEEGSYLWIKDGAPAWTTGEDPGPDPEPEPTGKAELLLNPDYPDDFKCWDPLNNESLNVSDPSEWVKTQPCWTDPHGNPDNGIGVKGYGGTASFRIYVEDALGMVLTISASSIYGTYNGQTTATWTHQIKELDSNVTGIFYQDPVIINANGNPAKRTSEFTFLCQRPTFTWDFRLKWPGSNAGTGKSGAKVQNWKLEAPEQYLLNMHIKEQRRRAAAKENALRKREVITTTDIDL